MDNVVNTGLDSLGVCTDGSQDYTPEGCQFPSTRFIDGTYTDNNAVALLVSQLQQKHGAGQKMRIMVHISSPCTASAGSTIQESCMAFSAKTIKDYFDTTAGKTEWSADWAGPFPLPSPARQIFQGAPPEVVADPLTTSTDDASFFSYAYQKDLTTVGNAAYGISAGTKVDLMMFFANIASSSAGSDIFGVGNSTTASYAQLADDACHSMANVVKEFYDGADITPDMFQESVMCHGQTAIDTATANNAQYNTITATNLAAAAATDAARGAAGDLDAMNV